ncbi:hypothetical protein ID866_3776 [Astraeus odoratus]|nr:hypothetical protein ID866_3776 [Astraeus odoratus]
MGFLYERRSRRSRLRSQRLVFFLLRLFWVAFVIWHDFGAFVYSLAGCKWPDKALESWSSSATRPTRVMLIADVQVPNPATTRNLWFGEDPVTTYLRKSWSAVSRLRPDVVIFLGDVLSSGRYVRSKQEYDAYYDRFKSIFQHGNGTSFYFIPGNTDVGLGRSSSFTEDAPRFFTEYFGPLNQLVTIAGHKFVMIDASKLVEEDYHRHAHDKTYEQAEICNMVDMVPSTPRTSGEPNQSSPSKHASGEHESAVLSGQPAFGYTSKLATPQPHHVVPD